MLQQTLGESHLTFSCDEARLVARQATSLALVTNELVSNAHKHGRQPTNISFRVSDGDATLVVSDDGPGFPAGFDTRRTANTGLELVESIVRWDLRGQTEYTNRPEGGAQISVCFSIATA
jgi:two-component sensor histidine kinase